MGEEKKVVHVMRRFVPEKWGGTESVVFNLSQQLQKSGAESPVFCTSMFSQPGLQIVRKLAVRRFSYIFPWFGLSENETLQLELKGGNPLSLSLFFSLLLEKDVGLIHSHVQHRLGGIARTAAKLKGIPYVVSIHGGYFTLPAAQREQMMAPFKGKVEWGKLFGALLGARRVLKDASAVICVGQAEFDEAKKRFPGKPVHLIPNGVDFERFSKGDGAAFRKKYGFKTHEKIMLCVSRIDPQKNQLGLVRAFAEFAPLHPDHRLVLIGPVAYEGYRDEILAEAEALEVADNVTLIEGLRPDDPLLPGAYQAAEFSVLPSVHEPFGIVVLEAWAAGVPVIASNVCGISDFASDRENLLLFEAGNTGELVERMTELADQVTLRTDLSCRAYGDAAMHFAWPKIARKYQSVYEETVKNA
jgi:glycosyltransferase involved in cell wall biosynthesis